jgi:hypothetical protein
MGGGYRDMPCTGDPPAGCATPLPRVDPSAASGERPLRIASRDIRLDHVGEYKVALGSGSLANGVLEQASFTLANLHPQTFFTTEAGVRLQVKSLERGGKPFDNYYAHGWRKGLERFSATLVFTVSSLQPGAVLQIRDVVVR